VVAFGKYVSRAGGKLQIALEKFKVDVSGLICADFGSSTGGFTDCLLKNGAKKVYSIDTSYGELNWNLRKNPKVVVLERTNAMHVVLPEKMDLITIDVGWTKQEKIIKNALKNLKKGGKIIALIKLQYEAPHSYIKKGKLDEGKVSEVIRKVRKDIKISGGNIEFLVKSPILGERAKNIEYLALISCVT